MNDCLFCKIVKGEIPSGKVYEDDKVLAFSDIDPKAPVHILIIPKKHIQSIAHSSGEDYEIYAHIIRVAKELAEKFELGKGYRLVTNTGPEAGQTVNHLHFHLLGGRPMAWPPG